MTTAARPTFDPARGGSGRGEKDLSAISRQYSSRDLPGHTKLKYREPGQHHHEDLKHRDFRRELEDKESGKDKDKDRDREQQAQAIAGAGAGAGAAAKPAKGEPPLKRSKQDQVPAASLDADDPAEEDDDDDDDDDEDDTAALLAELNKIKKERAQEQAKKEIEKRQEEERIRMENILAGNPLLSYSSGGPKPDLKVKRRWDDDVVFKNCARSEPEKKPNTFINDSLRSEFHRKFMEKYIK